MFDSISAFDFIEHIPGVTDTPEDFVPGTNVDHASFQELLNKPRTAQLYSFTWLFHSDEAHQSSKMERKH